MGLHTCGECRYKTSLSHSRHRVNVCNRVSTSSASTFTAQTVAYAAYLHTYLPNLQFKYEFACNDDGYKALVANVANPCKFFLFFPVFGAVSMSQ